MDRDRELSAYCHGGVAPGGRWLDKEEQRVTIARRCIDSSQYSAQIMAEHRAVVRFSGTVSPLELFQRLHGQLDSADAGQAVTSIALRARTPFRSEQIKVLAVTDINTFYHQRQQTLPQVCQLLEMLQRSQPGRYLLAMPSYQYLNQLADCAHVPEHFLSQSQFMDEKQQQELLQRFPGHGSSSVRHCHGRHLWRIH